MTSGGSIARLIRACKSWDDFRSKVDPLSRKAKGDAFEMLVKLYLQLDPVYRTELRSVWLYDEVPSRVRRQLRLPGRDMGIDILAETTDHKYWAVQAKYRTDPRRSLTFHELSTFTTLAYLTCRKIDFALVCTTTDRVTRMLEGLPGRIGFRTSEAWYGLGGGFFQQARARLSNKAPRTKVAKPRPHQKRAIRNAVEHYQKYRQMRGKLIMPCGTGKTLTAYWIADRLKARTILIAVPSLALIRQTLEVWLKEVVAQGRKVRWLCVCSDESAGKPRLDELTAYTHDLGVKCFTDPKKIASWLRDHQRGTRIVFTTYQSGKSLADGARRANTSFDLGIMDEAHKTVGAKGKTFAHLLFDRNVPIRRRLFMTATERRYRGRSDQILSMDDPEVYGSTFELLTFKEAIQANPPILSDYEVLVIGASEAEIGDLIAHNIFVSPDNGEWEELEAETLAAVTALRKGMRRYRIRHALSFHSSIERAKRFSGYQDSFTSGMPSYGQLDTFHVSSEISTGERVRELRDFADSRRALITNARCLTEGVDVPDIDCVLFGDPKKSTIDIVQATGRALRLSPGKRKGYVLIPLLISEQQEPERLAESAHFREVLFILRALASNDERIIEYFRVISRGRRSRSRIVRFDTGGEIRPEGISLDTFTEALELRLWDKLAMLSWRSFEEARAAVRAQRLKNTIEWKEWCRGELRRKSRRPADIPAAPDTIYRDQGWAGWADWLGADISRHGGWRDFHSAQRFVRSLGLKRFEEWQSWCRGKVRGEPRRPPDIPADPYKVYASEGWAGWADWLGTGPPRREEWRDFQFSRSFVRNLGLKGMDEWRSWCQGTVRGKPKRPGDIPTHPHVIYKDKGWVSWGDWLATGRSSQGEWRDFEFSRRFARRLGLKSNNEWRRWLRGDLRGKPKRPADIPINPDRAYAGEGWAGWADWLGTGKPRPGELREFGSARRFVRRIGLRTIDEWYLWWRGELRGKPRCPADIPATPERVYKDNGWVSWGDWLGTGKPSRGEWRDFKPARRFVRRLDLSGNSEWRRWLRGDLRDKPKRPVDIPATPEGVYRNKGWIGWGDWLGTSR